MNLLLTIFEEDNNLELRNLMNELGDNHLQTCQKDLGSLLQEGTLILKSAMWKVEKIVMKNSFILKKYKNLSYLFYFNFFIIPYDDSKLPKYS